MMAPISTYVKIEIETGITVARSIIYLRLLCLIVVVAVIPLSSLYVLAARCWARNSLRNSLSHLETLPFNYSRNCLTHSALACKRIPQKIPSLCASSLSPFPTFTLLERADAILATLQCSLHLPALSTVSPCFSSPIYRPLVHQQVDCFMITNRFWSCAQSHLCNAACGLKANFIINMSRVAPANPSQT